MSVVRQGGSGAPNEFRLDRATYNVMISRIAERKCAYEREKMAASRAAILSDRLRRYSKSLFEEALDGAMQAASTKSGRRSLPVISPGHVALPNDIRLRPTTAGPNSGGTATSKNRERIRTIIGESNTKYRVIPSPGVRPTSGDVTGYRQYVLMPKDGDTEKTPSAIHDQTWKSEQPVAPPTNHQDNQTNSQCSENDVPEQNRSHDVGEANDDVTHGQEGEAEGESDKTAITETPDRKQENDAAPCENGVDAGQPTSPTGGASSSLTSSSMRARYRRVTWVDELTVSTPRSVTKPEINGDGDEGAVAADRRENGEPEVQRVINLNDLRANCWSLPGFVCPRSEEKSREARMREWIQTTNFNIARRTLPLL